MNLSPMGASEVELMLLQRSEKNANAGGITTAGFLVYSSNSNSFWNLLWKADSGSFPVGAPIQDILLFLFVESFLFSCRL